MNSYGVYVGQEDKGYIIADSLFDAELRAKEMYPESSDEITVSFTEVEGE